MKRRSWAMVAMTCSLIGCTGILGIDKFYSLEDGAGTSDGSVDSSVDGGGRDAGPPLDPSCLVSSPIASMETVRELCGIFVAPEGADGNPGTRELPVQTLKAGVLKASAVNKRVYVCNATYTETVAPVLPVEMYGGFDCANNVWSRADSTTPEVVASAGEPALFVKEVGGAVRIEDFTFRAGAATSDQKPSSIAAIVIDTTSLYLARVKLFALDARNGRTSSTAPAPAAPAAIKGGGSCDPTVCQVCNGGGGDSVSGGCAADSASAGAPAYNPPSPAGATGAGGGTGSGCAQGTRGSDATKGGGDGDGGAYGRVVGDKFVPEPGAPGETGPPGQGGGGARGAGFGATGGCGGCGGGGGPGGGGGGASIGIVARNTRLEIVASTITSGKAGDGSDGKVGAPGADGAGGGSAGSCFLQGRAIAGGGGKGGAGGTGGGGAGGISACVVSLGAAASLDDATRTACTHGAAGAPGQSPARPGAPGVSEVLVQIP